MVVIDPNKNLTKELRILADFYKKKGDTWRATSYAKAIVTIQNLDFKLKTKAEAMQLPGIGKGIAEKIEEFTKSKKIRKVGSVQKEDKLLKKRGGPKLRATDAFEKIWGVGPIKAKNLYNLGYKSITDLRKTGQKHLTAQQLIGLKYYTALQAEIPRARITKFQNKVLKLIDSVCNKDQYRFEVAGSYRRKKKTSGDIDCVLASKNFTLKEFVDLLKAAGIIVETLTESKKGEKFMGVADLDGQIVRLDIEFVKDVEKSWWTTLVYFTGSKGFNIALRNEAKKRGYKLDQHSLMRLKDFKDVKIKSEKELFNLLGFSYLPPEKRG
jgi:DNA polymerase/3'-5' exonuclease PolX